jgi:K+-transporting ATPase, c chain
MNDPDGRGDEGVPAGFERDEHSQIPQPLAAVLEQLRPALVSVPLLTLLTGVVFPLALAALACPLFPRQAGGSLIVTNGVVGSELIGQDFTEPGYFQARPSAAGRGYDAAASGGTNLGPANPKLRDGARDDPATPSIDESFAGVRELTEIYRASNGLAPRGRRARGRCHPFGKRSGSAHQPGERGTASPPGGTGPRLERRGSPRPPGRTHPRSTVRYPRRAQGGRAPAQPGPRPGRAAHAFHVETLTRRSEL